MEFLNNEGIEVLSEIPIINFNLIEAISICFVILFCFLILGMFITYISRNIGGCFICILIGCILGAALGLAVGISDGRETGKYQYKVKIDETVSLVEFFKNYDIVSSETENIFVIQIKDQDNNTEIKTKENQEVNIKE